MLLRTGECCIEERRVCYWGEDSVLLRREKCNTVERRMVLRR